MKLLYLASAILLCMALNSCKEDPIIPEKNEFSSENYYDFGGDEISRCMTGFGENSLLFTELGGGDYAVIVVDKEGKENRRQTFNSAYPNFEAEAMTVFGPPNQLQLFVTGALDNRPAWVILNLDGSNAFFPETWNNDAGRFYSCQLMLDHVLVAGEKMVAGDRQVFLSKIGLNGIPTDSASFGTPCKTGELSCSGRKTESFYWPIVMEKDLATGIFG